MKRKLMQAQKDEINNIKSEINGMKTDLADIKTLMLKLLEKG
jgi:archaellum component FlaC